MFGTSPIELLAADAMLRGTIFCNGYIYSAQWLTGTTSALGANASVDQTIQITSEADFVVQQITGNSFTGTGTIITDPDYTINIAISSGRPWFDRAQTWRDVMPSFQSTVQVLALPFPRLIPAQTTLTLTLANRTATPSNRATIALSGFNVYYQTETRQQVFHAL
jgi:hypothetical protein